MNVAHAAVRIRPLARSDVRQMQAWQRHTDPLLTPYNVPVLADAQQAVFWDFWTGKAATVSLAGELEGRFIAHILLRDYDADFGSADLGISMDPAFVGQGLGTQFLRLTRRYAATELGIQKITLEVAGWNLRALRAYEKAGFVETGRVWMPWDTPVDFQALLADPARAWLKPFVRIDTGYTIVLVRMCAQNSRSI
ncbi:MAG: GNAT family N-acetyltransferase [Candidatus Eremiobacteraeota bacterium]|nr:GNAT family N-acetyltransferase [Candidatus Eremiobacteraeota bacterium]